MVGKTEKVNPKIAKFKYAANGLSFNVDDSEIVASAYELIGISYAYFIYV